MTRICCVFGPWQLLTLVAALRQVSEDSRSSTHGSPDDHDDYLMLYETGGVSQEFKEIVDRMARAAWPWKAVAWAYDLLTNEWRLTDRALSGMLKTVRERIGVTAEQASEVWVCYLTRPAEKLVFEAFPHARIVLYEDGLISYIPVEFAKGMDPTLAPPRAWLRRLRQWTRKVRERWSPAVRLRYTGDKLDPRHLARLTGAYLQLAPSEPPPAALAAVPRHFVDYEILRSVLKQVAQALKGELEAALPRGEEAAPDRILILGQALSRNGTTTREQEFTLYRAVVEAVLAKGYVALWKEHPRISQPFFDDLKAEFGGSERLQLLRLPHVYPIELVAERLDLAGCVVGTSAAPFYLRRLYRIPCFTFANDLLSYIQGVDIFMNEMVRREAPPLAELPPYRDALSAKIE